ncbi:MAG: HigA family addiction module antidote protein [Zoogloeaceae bacterium]|jgi:addiction module HigA family antidote|nr:HigA family addiction module antidote protein [Zoogloeaceae bacterium]
MSQMHNPPHPGETLREDVLPALGLSVTEAAAELGISRVALSRVLNGKAGISLDLAMRLEEWIGGATAETWLKIQLSHDLWRASQKKDRRPIKRHAPVARATTLNAA